MPPTLVTRENKIAPTPCKDAQVVGSYRVSNRFAEVFWPQSQRITPLHHNTFFTRDMTKLYGNITTFSKFVQGSDLGCLQPQRLLLPGRLRAGFKIKKWRNMKNIAN